MRPTKEFFEAATKENLLTYQGKSKYGRKQVLIKLLTLFNYWSNQKLFFFFFYLGFLSGTFTIHRTAGEGGGHLFNSSLPLPPASLTLRQQPGDNCRELTSTYGYQPDQNREPLVSERQSLTTTLHAVIAAAKIFLLK